ncbi:MAG: hypothetical protein QF878_09550, partial [SAR202 cluster bacterium]|nr:hypothetical protein [SAR202 cluster bacterium]
MRFLSRRYIVAVSVLVISVVLALVQPGGSTTISALEETLIPPGGRDQLPLVYVHGFNDDGASWGTVTGPYWNALRDITPGAGDPLNTPVENYAVQFGAPNGNPFATAEQGWAVLHTPAEMALPSPEEAAPGQASNPYNSSDPVTYFLTNIFQLFNWIPVCEVYLPFPSGCTIPAVEFLEEISERRVKSNYNRNGETRHHAKDLQDLLRSEFGGGKFDDDRQVNIITHSAGGIDTRALLALLNRGEFQREKEAVANVMFTAPPFGGSTIAEVANIFYDDLDSDVVFNPWLAAVIENRALESPIKDFLQAIVEMDPSGQLSEAQVNQIINTFDAAAEALGYKLLATGATLNSLPSDRNALVGAIELIRPIVTDLFGFPGTPKVNVDLRPSGAVSNLREWERNPNTQQFVTWGEGGIGYNLSPNIEDIADDNYGVIDDVTTPGNLKAHPGDIALTKVSARALTTDAP